MDAFQKQTADQFHIVGVGASAGGLESFRKFLRAIPEDSRMAYVLVQHLAADHESMLPELLARETVLPVQVITDDIRLLPDNIYVIPQNKTLTATDGILKLWPREPGVANMPIDIFFNSLAETHKSFAIGVVLSGAGADGTVGLQTIKEMGGSTFAQDPETAAFESMPRHAVLSESVDFILAPELIPAQLLSIRDAYSANDAHADQGNLTDSEDAVFRQILHLLHNRTGNDFTHYKQATIRRRIARRMVMTKNEDAVSYLAMLRADHLEQDALFNDILIPVSYFFRDAKPFESLSVDVLPIIVRNRPASDKIRIWCAGCSTGEEAYSIAITVSEFLQKHRPELKVQIFATDISERVIARARAGIYSRQDVGNVPEARLQQHFTKTDGSYVVNKAIRDMCVFAVHNFVKDPPFAKLDLVTCRNVLIYLDSHLQSKALTTFHYALKDTGILMLGKSETTGSASVSLFSPLSKNEKIYSRKPVPGHFSASLAARPEFAQPEKQIVPHKTMIQPDFQKLAFDVLFSKYTPAAVVVNKHKDIVYFHGDTSAFLRPTPGKPNFNLLKMAREGLDFELRNALLKAKAGKEKIAMTGIPVKNLEKDFAANIEVTALPSEDGLHYLVVFFKSIVQSVEAGADRRETDKIRIKKLEAELEQIREDIRAVTESQEATIEELQSANEELLSGSEELQTLNEELETSAEEMQSNNEELISVNDELLDRQEQLNAARNYAEAIVSTIREPLVVIDGSLRVKTANSSFYKFFGATEAETEGMPFFELGGKVWDRPELRVMLQELLPKHAVIENYEVAFDFPGGKSKNLQINARRIINNRHSEPLILLAISEIV